MIDWAPASAIILPQINAEGLHIWPFDKSFPMDVRHFSLDSPFRMRMNRHSFFEIAYVDSGRVELQVQDRLFEACAGDVIVIGSSLYHRMTNVGREPVRLRVLYFEGSVIQGCGKNDESEEYLSPFLLKSSDFPHVMNAEADATREVDGLMERLSRLLPACSNRGRLAARTLLRMVLMLLVDHYAECCDTQRSLEQRQSDLDRLGPVFKMIEDRHGEALRVNAMES